MVKYTATLSTGKTAIEINKANGKNWNKNDYKECAIKGFVSNGFKNIAFQIYSEESLRNCFTLDTVVSEELMDAYRKLEAL